MVDSGCITLKDAQGARDVRIALATADIAQALQGSELIALPTPATAQDDIARLMAPASFFGLMPDRNSASQT